MKTKLILALLFLFTMSYTISAQQDIQNNCSACELMVISAFPQLLTGKNITFTETMLIRTQAIKDGIMLDNGKVVNREELADIVFKELKRPELALHFGKNPPKEAKLVGYILEMSNKNEKHFVLTGLDKKPLYNYCNATGSVTSTQEVFVYAK